MKHVDVAIIGASLAGAACVRELARRGIDAVAFERDAFPREKVCGGFLSPGAVELLDELEVLQDVRAAGAVEVRSARVRFGDAEARVTLPKPGLGISRGALDAILAKHSGVVKATVRDVRRTAEGFRVQLEDGEITARVVVDAAGKLSRFSNRVAGEQFGVQFFEPESCGDVLDFWFFKDGYGGAVTVEGGRSNASYLIYKDALPRYLGKPGCLVTGPVAYASRESEFIAVGDAAGMIDPFCGEGMRHALDSGMLAARAVAVGGSYEGMRDKYRRERDARWKGKRRLGGMMRALLHYSKIGPKIGARLFEWKAVEIMKRVWA